MDTSFLMSEDVVSYVYIPLLICLARITDQSIGTLRIIFVSKGMKNLAPIFGFFEVIIWLMAIRQIMTNLNNPVNYIAYGAGFGIGNYIGIRIEERLSLGYVLLRVITRKSAYELETYFRESGNRFTIVDAESDQGPVNIFFLPMRRSDVTETIENVRKYNPRAFYTLEDVRKISDTTLVFPDPLSREVRWHRIIPKHKAK